ncbi:Predicted oxidoreductase [Jatrophihabitans endophyticus]|uniref:Predicted oxidoreductase n=1 Tax=Jatrophihabitans endophyticus TaxID=1206085 RepID=A0A1M5BY78_9ACTN|nr:aldo/keto reductase [Jatrophihabitans endophyticus]SHF47478.1 Predicted oxidoreductase [Jatrophihabitans endophyticus]
MKQRTVGTSGLRVSHLGVGTWRWGRETDADEAAAILVAFLDAGGTLVDTAVSYADGAAEEILAGLLADVVPREELVLAGKAGLRFEDGQGVVDNSRGRLLGDLDRSLRRLGVDHLDLWQVHVPDPHVAVEETLSALDTAVESGKVRYVGVSNFSGWRTAQAATLQAAKPAFAPIVSNQVRYSLLARGVERDVVPACLGLGVGVLPYSPLGGGALTGKYRTGIPADSRAAAGTRHLADLDDPATVGVVEAVATAAEGLATSPLAISLAWVRDRPGVAAPIIGPRTLGQLTAALAAETLDLPPAIRSALDDVSAPRLQYPETVS